MPCLAAAISIRRAKLAGAFVVIAAAALLAAPALGDPAGESQGGVTSPASPAARGISDLFWLITWIAMAVGIFVESLIVYTLFKFRAVKKGAGAEGSDERGDKEVGKEHGDEGSSDVHPTHHGNTKLEAGYTAVTAVVFALLVVLSAGTLFAIETPQEPVDMYVNVTGSQWSWKFYYPALDITEVASLSEMHVPVNKTVALNVTSTDVAHAVWVPELGVKIDAYPGRNNHFWFKAEREGRFLLQCAEFCGGAHSEMHAVVVAESQASFDQWVATKRAAANPPPPPLSDHSVVNVTLRDFAINLSAPLNVDLGANITFNITNAGPSQHGFRLGAPYNVTLALLNATESKSVNFSFNQSVTNSTYYCPIAGHAATMVGGLNVSESARIVDVYLHDNGIAGDSYHIEPAVIVLHPGDFVKFRVHNNGSMEHNLKIGPPYNVISPTIAKNLVTFTPAIVVAGSAEYWCDVPGHRQSGMQGTMDAGGAIEKSGETVPGFDLTTVMPAVSLAAVAVLWHRQRRKGA